MKNIFKSLFIVMSCLMASSVWAEEDPTLAINTEGQGTSDFLGAYAEQGIVLSSSESFSSGAVQLGNTPNTSYDQYYFEVLADATIDSVSFLLSGNGSNKSIQAPVFGWAETATSNTADTYRLLDAVTVTANSYTAAQWFTYDFSDSEIKCARIYRSSKMISSVDPAYTGTSTALGSNQTIKIWGLKVWLADNTPTDQPVSSVKITGPTGGIVGDAFTLKAKSIGGQATEFWWTEGNGSTHIGENNELTITPTAKGTYVYKAWAQNEYNDSPVSATHTIEIIVPSGEIIKATTQQVVTGTIGGRCQTNLSKGDSKKLDKEKYFGVTLAKGTFAEKDTFVIDITDGADLGKCMIYADQNGNELLYDEGIVYTKADAASPVICPTGLKKIVLTEDFNGKSSLYLYRENGNTQWNPKFSYIAVIRPEEEHVPVPVEGISIDPDEISIEEGKSATLTAIFEPSNPDNKNVTWESSDEDVATVDENGIVTAVAVGDATITVKTEDGEYTAECTVTVTEPVVVDVEEVQLDQESLELTVGENKTLVLTITPSDAIYQSIVWTSDNEEAATVDQTGKVTAVAEGDATITVTVTTTDDEFTADCTVSVTEPEVVEVEEVQLDQESLELTVGENKTLVLTITPSDAIYQSIVWTSDNEEAATVDQTGKVTAVAEGDATITVTVTTAEDEFTADCTVSVTVPAPIAVTGVSLNKTSLTLKEEGTETLTATVTPNDAADRSVTWTSSDESVATVNANGKVTAVAVGTAIITVTTTDQGKTATCTVTVEAKSTTPETGLNVHYPEVYEDPAGYNTPLVNYQGREYEVYYTAKGKVGGQGSGVPLVYVDAAGNEISNGTKAKDGWFEYTINSGDGSSTEKSGEFTVTRGTWKTTTDNYLMMRVKGFDMFRFFAKEKKDSDPNQELHVFIDDLENELDMTHSTSATVREFEMSTGEHVIKVTATGSSNQYIYGWSLRVSDDPIVRYLGGDKDQTVYQTKDIERVAFRVRRAKSHRLSWVGNAIPGVSMVDGTNDSVFVQGTANAAAGVYTYKVEALDAAGAVASYETGKITIATHVFDNRTGNDFTTNIGEAIKPLNFTYYASSSESIDIQWNGNAIDGLGLTFSRDSIATLSGTPTAVNAGGEYSYSIVAAGGNTISGTITLVVPGPYFEPFDDAKIKNGKYLNFTVQTMHASNVTVTGLPSWMSYSFDAATGIVTFSGTPTIGGQLPKNFPFTMTATPKYQGQEEATATGKIIVIDPNLRTVLLICKDLKSIYDDPIAAFLYTKRYDITLRYQDKLEGSNMEAFDMLLISENVDANNEAVLALIKSAPKPVLNMKAFTYVYERDEDTPNGWGEPDNGSLSDEGRFIYIQREDHPIIQRLNTEHGMGLKHGSKIMMLNAVSTEQSINKKGLMPINIFRKGTYCIATAHTRSKADYNGDGGLQTFLHEEPAALRGGNKYICLPIALTSSANLSQIGKNMVEAIVNYLIDDEPAVLARVPLQITGFSIDGVEGVIEEGEYEGTITVDIDVSAHPDVNIREIAPQITVASEYTHVVPASGETVNMQWSDFNPVAYVVTDYINRYVYNVTVNLFDPRGIEEVEYEPGMWVNIFDIYGRKITTTNENIHTMDLPRGIYIVVTENGKSMKIMR